MELAIHETLQRTIKATTVLVVKKCIVYRLSYTTDFWAGWWYHTSVSSASDILPANWSTIIWAAPSPRTCTYTNTWLHVRDNVVNAKSTPRLVDVGIQNATSLEDLCVKFDASRHARTIIWRLLEGWDLVRFGELVVYNSDLYKIGHAPCLLVRKPHQLTTVLKSVTSQ